MEISLLFVSNLWERNEIYPIEIYSSRWWEIIHCKYSNLKQTYVSTFQISPFKLRKMEIYAYSIEDSSRWRETTFIANIPTLNKRILSNFIQFQITKDGNFSNLCLLYRGFLSVTRNHIHCKYLNKRNLIPSNLGKMEISQIFAPNLRERNEIYPIEDSSR